MPIFLYINDSHMPIVGWIEGGRGWRVSRTKLRCTLRCALPAPSAVAVAAVLELRSTQVAIHTVAHIAKLDEVLDEYALFIIAQTLLATTLYTELFQ